MTAVCPPDVSAALQALPQTKRLQCIRTLILEIAVETETAPLTETLKWGQPAYLPAKRDGTTIRLGADERHAKLFVHCQTTLVESLRARFPTEFIYDGNRAVLIPRDSPLDRAALSQVIAAALTYHRRKRGAS